jgi:hypothetical protein
METLALLTCPTVFTVILMYKAHSTRLIKTSSSSTASKYSSLRSTLFAPYAYHSSFAYYFTLLQNERAFAGETNGSSNVTPF